VRFDPQTHDFTREDIPSGGVVRNLDPDFKLYLACSG
jgi:hypothetical protein